MIVTRSATVPRAPARGNSRAATAEPNCTESVPASIMPTPVALPTRAGAVTVGGTPFVGGTPRVRGTPSLRRPGAKPGGAPADAVPELVSVLLVMPSTLGIRPRRVKCRSEGGYAPRA